MKAQKVGDNLEAIKTDASRVLADVVALAKNLTDFAGDGKSRISDLNLDFQEEIEMLKAKVEQVSKAISSQTESVDKHIKNSPYLYIMGALGVGVIGALGVGTLLGKYRHRSSRE